MSESFVTFWKWFSFGTGGRPGYQRIVNGWLFFHLVIGLALSFGVSKSLSDASNAILIPAIGILIGLSFTWAGNAFTILKEKHIRNMADYHAGGFTEYAFSFQIAILGILVTLILWGIAGLGVIDGIIPFREFPVLYFFVKVVLFSSISLSIRECWHVVLEAQYILIAEKIISDHVAKPKQ